MQFRTESGVVPGSLGKKIIAPFNITKAEIKIIWPLGEGVYITYRGGGSIRKDTFELNKKNR